MRATAPKTASFLSLALAAACAVSRPAGSLAERERAAVLEEASLSLSSLQGLVDTVPQELEPLQRRVEQGEASEALQRALMSLVDRCTAVADDAERSVDSLRSLRQPPSTLPRFEADAAQIAEAARTTAVQALDLADVVSTRMGGLPMPVPALMDYADRAAPPEVQQLLENAADLAAAELVKALGAHQLESLVVIPSAVSLDQPSRTDSAAVYGRQFSRRLAEALRGAGLPATFTSQCARDLEGTARDSPALLSSTLALHGSEVTFSLYVVDLRDRRELAVATGSFTPPTASW